MVKIERLIAERSHHEDGSIINPLAPRYDDVIGRHTLLCLRPNLSSNLLINLATLSRLLHLRYILPFPLLVEFLHAVAKVSRQLCVFVTSQSYFDFSFVFEATPNSPYHPPEKYTLIEYYL